MQSIRCLRNRDESNQLIQMRDFEQKHGKLNTACEYKLVFATESNIIYTVYFDRCCLLKSKTVFVRKSDQDFLAQLQNNTIKAFDVIEGVAFVIGTCMQVPPAER